MAIRAGKVGLILLAAGRSERWGEGHKLAAMLDGKPLALHAAEAFAVIPFAHHVAISGPGTPDLRPLGFEVVATDRPEAGQSYSLTLGIRELLDTHVAAVLIALADMPFVEAAHLEALLEAFEGQPVASTSGAGSSPPAIFGREQFEGMLNIEGDKGARGLLKGARLISASARCLADIDCADDLRHWDNQS